MKKTNPVVHFEMPAENRVRMAGFYSTVFGWKTQMLGEDMGNYVTVSTTKSDEHGRPTMQGAVNGGFYPKREDWPAQYPSIVIAVEEIHASIREVTEAGGAALGEPAKIPGIGLYISFYDTEDNHVSLLQPLMSN
jgi:predicted enzyme related to lactoylglutathione lyase